MSRTRVERNISFDDEKKKYYVNLDFGRDARGRQIKKTRTFARLTDARKALRLHEVQRDFGALTQPNDTTVTQWLNCWMDAVVRPNRAATTVHGYSQMVVNHIIPQLGDVPLQSLSPQRIQQYYAHLCHDCGLSPNTARKHHDLLRNALRIAVIQDVLARNPTDRVEPPKFKHPEPHYYDVESLLRLLDTTMSRRSRPSHRACAKGAGRGNGKRRNDTNRFHQEGGIPMHLMQILRAIYVIVPPFVCLLALVVSHIYIYQQRSQSEQFTNSSPQEDEELSPDVSADEPMPAALTNTAPRVMMYESFK